jgi:VWFA-related protein
MRHLLAVLIPASVAVVFAAGGPAPTIRAHASRPSVQPAATAALVRQQPTFRVTVDLVTTDAVPRDTRTRQFIADLKPGEFEIYEDGLKQTIVSMELIHGQRAYNLLALPSAPAQESLILPPSRPPNDSAGRVFLVVIDDLHLDFQHTPRLRTLLKNMLQELIHEGDMFGVVSTGTSSISQQLTYDRQILESISNKVSGGGLKPAELINASNPVGQASELRHRAHVAFGTAYDLVNNLQKIHNRSKVILYISNGYDFNPFDKSRAEQQAQRLGVQSTDLDPDPFISQDRRANALSEADLIREEVELTRAANRANATFYTIDLRGLVAGPDIASPININLQDWNDHVRKTQDSLRQLAENTGGFAIVNRNDLGDGLKRIDAETSDYYVLGYSSTNPDPRRRTRVLEVKVSRPNVAVKHRPSYTFRQVGPSTSAQPK